MFHVLQAAGFSGNFEVTSTDRGFGGSSLFRGLRFTVYGLVFRV